METWFNTWTVMYWGQHVERTVWLAL